MLYCCLDAFLNMHKKVSFCRYSHVHDSMKQATCFLDLIQKFSHILRHAVFRMQCITVLPRVPMVSRNSLVNRNQKCHFLRYCHVHDSMKQATCFPELIQKFSHILRHAVFRMECPTELLRVPRVSRNSLVERGQKVENRGIFSGKSQ